MTLSEEEFDDDETRDKPQQRNAANARERARMRVLSRAFCRLKTTLPWVPPDTKLSKLDTLRLATSYIAHLRAVLCLDDDEDEDQTRTQNTIHPLNLVSPCNEISLIILFWIVVSSTFGSSIYSDSAYPVSYTHLDVYKRQG